ncbi:hypothetical protein HDU84_006165 [Entophlyctis sp. JEL0112]|nr:hypothetical protein HDU84_006165 [Entophlyctis sp. JEL0112]
MDTTATNALDALHAAVLDVRRAAGLVRTVRVPAQASVDFASNDYLGLARSRSLHAAFVRRISPDSDPDSHSSLHSLSVRCENQPHGRNINGSSGSRLLTGASLLAERLEDRLAAFHHAEAALLFNSGYDANVGLFSVIAHPHSAVLYDSLIHASVHDGLKCRRKLAVAKPWNHNDLAHLESLVQIEVHRIESSENPCAGIIVAVEAVYSMDGDTAPLRDLVRLKKQIGSRAGGLHIVVDEAHSNGVFGDGGRGLVCELGFEQDVYARLVTFGKAVGAHGGDTSLLFGIGTQSKNFLHQNKTKPKAAVLGSATFREYLVNYARPLIYSTAISPHSLAAIDTAYTHLQKHAPALQKRLQALIAHYRTLVYSSRILPNDTRVIDSVTAIQGIIVPGNQQVTRLCEYLQGNGYDVRPIRSPTVEKGSERLRVCLHTHNTEEEIESLVRVIARGLVQFACVGSAGDSQALSRL